MMFNLRIDKYLTVIYNSRTSSISKLIASAVKFSRDPMSTDPFSAIFI